MKSANQQLNDCLKYTSHLIKLARQGEWKELEEKLELRNRQLEKLYQIEFSTAEATDARQLIQQIQLADQELMGLVTANRDRVFKELKKGDKGQKMKAAYRQSKRSY